ncbi:MAG: hypothetical protein LC624_10460 [Halobacteriales archaeon]|nr:hypothetical protein [Halobacteriales archaeon]
MVSVREHPAAGFRLQAPVGQVLGEPRFRWNEQDDVWLYRVDLVDSEGREVGRGWSGMHELPLAWLRAADGDPPELMVGGRYRWRVYAYRGPPTEDPAAASGMGEFVFLGP